MPLAKPKISVLIADDSALMRREIKNILESDPDISVVGAARDGREAVEMTKQLEPDVVALDINMPGMDGLTALQLIMMESPRPVVMVSSLTQEGALTTYEALELGATDFVGKPGGTISLDIARVAQEMIMKIKGAALARTNRIRLRRTQQVKKTTRERAAVAARPKTSASVKARDKIVVIGQSTGGPNTIFDIIPLLPEDLGPPVIIVQHMPSGFTPSFAARLDSNCAFPFKEAARGDLIEPGKGYLAPGDVHLSLVARSKTLGGCMARLTEHPKDARYYPSVDVTMDSALAHYGANTIGVLLTGMGDDGADAMVHIRQAGGRTIAESEETAVVFGMPAEAIRRGGAEFVLPSYKIAEKIIELVRS